MRLPIGEMVTLLAHCVNNMCKSCGYQHLWEVNSSQIREISQRRMENRALSAGKWAG